MSDGRPRAVVRIPGGEGGVSVLVWAPGAASFASAVALGDGSLEAEVGSIVALSAAGAPPRYYLVTGSDIEELTAQ